MTNSPGASRSPVWRDRLRRLSALPKPQTEESILLRILTQGLVSAGIIATDVAVPQPIPLSTWAIPLSLLGAYWSWRSRHRPNIATKFCIAIGMLGALVAFFVGLREELNDTRLVLAELLVQLQVLHSFHMPRRQDLGYSMVIGLILIGVASTLSQTMTFGAVLLVFLAIALPVLVLDYRSRLGLRDRAVPLRQVGLGLKPLSLFFLIILSLGLTIFLLLPRLPGYQLRTFPVSDPIQQTFEDNTQIINPGYVRTGNQSTGGTTGSGNGQAGTNGQMDENTYYGFNSRINQNLRGQLKPKVVLRVRSQAEGFWRVLSFDRYLGQGWEISRNDETKTLTRPAWSYQFFLPRPLVLNRTREVIQTYTVVAELPNLIPALQQPRELYFPTSQIALDPDGNLRSPLELREGLTYTVISDVPYRDRTRLRSAPTDYPKDITRYYLEVPAQIRQRVKQRTEALLATSPNPLEEPYEKALYLAQTLKQRYSFNPDLPLLSADEDLVEAFLFKYQGGYPDHFSTALTMMLRSIGIPARLAVGFAPGEFNPFTGLYEVWNTDAYALTEVYFPQFGWFGFDPIPGHELIPPSIEEDQTFSALQKFWQWVAGWLPSPVSSWLGQTLGVAIAWVLGSIGWFVGLFSQGWVGLFTALLCSTLLAFGAWLLRQAWKTWQYRRWLRRLHPMEQIYQTMLALLAQQGCRKHPSQTPLEFGQSAQAHQPASHAPAIAEICLAYVRWRYGGEMTDLRPLQQHLHDLAPRQKRPL